IMGMGLREIMEFFKTTYGLVGGTDELIKERRGLMYELLLKNLTLMPGASELIKYLFLHHIPMAIATSGHSKEKTKEIIKYLGLEKSFTIFVSGDDFEKAKPAPDMYLVAAKMLHIDPKDCLVFEDAPNGVVAGKAAGTQVYAVNKDVLLQEKLRSAGADKVFSCLKDVHLDL
ncbi:MAG TPA: HAD-IA family hydrolase, partial [Patescibacteria group bacterium]